jgi:cysteine-rich repeat protein
VADVTGNAGTSETDIVTASGTDDDGEPVTEDDDATVHIVKCGDGILQPGEVCDDGNQVFGDGCTPTCQLETPLTAICNHPCPASIRFLPNLDKFFIRVGFLPTEPFDPSAISFGVTLQNANGVIFTGMLFPGDLKKAGHSWKFRDPLAARGAGIRDGIRFVSMSRRSDGLWRFQLKAFADLSAATDPVMTVIVMADSEVFTKTATWTELANGWKVNFNLVP